MEEQWWQGKDEDQKYVIVYGRLKTHYSVFKVAYERLMKRKVSWPDSWTGLTEAFRRKFIDAWVESSKGRLHDSILDWAVRTQVKKGKVAGCAASARNPQQLLLIYNGDFGLLPDNAEHVVPANLDIAGMTVGTWKHTQMLWASVKKDVLKIVESTKAGHYAASLELSCSTLGGEAKAVRLHVHVALKSSLPLVYKQLHELQVCAAKPVPSERICGKALRGRSDFCALYYVSCPKLGWVYHLMSALPHRDYPVDAKWIWNWLGSEKLSFAAAREELVAQTKDLNRHLPNLDRAEQERETKRLSAKIAAREVELAEVRRPWRHVHLVQTWLNTMSLVEGRRRFLVLDGPSQVGKSEYALALVPFGEGLRINCSNVEYPPLREFKQSRHRLLLFDEASAMLVLQNRLLFQAPNSLVQVGTSPTNKDCYNVYLHYCHIVIASNSWKSQMDILKKERHEDHEWLEANSVYIYVDTKLYATDAA